MKNRFLITSASIALAVSLLSACTTHEGGKKEVRDKMDLAKTQTVIDPSTTVEAGQVRVHNRAFGGGKAERNIHGDPLPPAVGQFELNSKGIGLELRDIATEINSQANLPVDVLDDMPGAAGARSSGSNAGCRMAPAYKGPLPRFLDALATWCDLTWSYTDGRLRLQNFETATYTFDALPTSNVIETAMKSSGLMPSSSGGSGSGGSSGGGSGSSGQSLDQSTSVHSDIKVWDEIKSALGTVVKPGTVDVSPSTRTIVVVAKHSAQTNAAKLIQEINRRQTRLVVFDVVITDLQMSDTIDLGLSLNALYNNLKGQYAIAATTPASLVSAGAASLTLSAQNNTASNKPSVLNGSDAVITALQNVGHVSNTQSQQLRTLDGKPVPVTVARQISYLASASTTANAATTSTGIQQQVLTVGLTMQLIPAILDDGQVLLQYAFGLSSLNALTSITSGGITLQSPDINVRSSVQQTIVGSGDTIVLMGYSQDNLNVQEQGLPGLADSIFGFIGGSNTHSRTRSALVIAITPHVLRNGVTGI